MSKRWMFSGLVLVGVTAAAMSWQFAGAQSIGVPSAPADEGSGGTPPSATPAPTPVPPSISAGGPPGAGGTITLVAPPGGPGAGATISVGPRGGGAPGGMMMYGGGQPAFVYGFSSGEADPEMMQLQQADAELEGQIQQAVQAYSAAGADEASRGDVRQQIQDLLDKQFTLRQQRREHEIRQIEERVLKLREALDKRADAKSKIIERRINDLLTDAEGLGWGDAGPSAGGVYGGVPGAGAPGPAFGGPQPRGGGRGRPGAYGGAGLGGGGYGRGGGAAPATDGGEGSGGEATGGGGRGSARPGR